MDQFKLTFESIFTADMYLVFTIYLPIETFLSPFWKAKAQYFYSLKVSYDALYEASQIFLFYNIV